MKLSALLSSVAAACLILPVSAFADPPPDRSPDTAKKEQAQRQGPAAQKGQGAEGRRQGAGAPPGQAAKGPPANAASAARGRQPQAQAVTPPKRPTQARPAQTPAPQRVERAPAAPAARPTAPTAQRQPGVRTGQQRPSPSVVRPAALPSLGEWRAPTRGPQRAQAGQQWRQQHQSWDQNARWRQAPDWWRNDSGFRLFTGLRMGFFFVPERGYIALPSQYRERHWQAGDYLPSWFRAYTVRDYARYGLPPPPYGCVWVWLNGDVALIDPSDGYILDIARNVW